jgi:hypothetical protein
MLRDLSQHMLSKRRKVARVLRTLRSLRGNEIQLDEVCTTLQSLQREAGDVFAFVRLSWASRGNGNAARLCIRADTSQLRVPRLRGVRAAS